MNKLYKYKERIEEIQEIEENEVVKDYRSGKMDPASDISRSDRFKKRSKKDGNESIISNLIQMRNIKAGVEYLRFT